MRARLQSQLFGQYFGSFSAHSYGYELSNDPKPVLKLLDFRFDPILGQPPRKYLWQLRPSKQQSFGQMIFRALPIPETGFFFGSNSLVKLPVVYLLLGGF